MALDRGRSSWVFFLAALAVTASCTSWQRTELPSDFKHPTEFSERRITLLDGRKVILRGPWFEGDTLRGRTKNGEVASYPIAQIAKFEADRFSVTETAILVGGIAAFIAVGAASVDCWGTYSCPHIYAWNGSDWSFECAPYVGAVTPSLARTDAIPLRQASTAGDIVRLRVTGVPHETEHIDVLRLLVVDHAPGLLLGSDPRGSVHAVGPVVPPVAARDFRGCDALQRVLRSDSVLWESLPTGRDPTRDEDIRDGLVIEFPRTEDAQEAWLLIGGGQTLWAANITSEWVALQGETRTASRAIAATVEEDAFLGLSIWDGARWRHQNRVPGSVLDGSKVELVHLDLSAVQGDTLRVRLDSAPLFWAIDRVALAFGPEQDCSREIVSPSDVHTSQGRDARALLARRDQRACTMEAQDTLEARFEISAPPTHAERRCFVEATGWYRSAASKPGMRDDSSGSPGMQQPGGALSRYSVVRLREALERMAASGRR